MTLTKIDDRGLKTPIDLLDDERIRLGTGNDLQLYHNGTESRIHSLTNTLGVRANLFNIRRYTDAQYFLNCTSSGAVELYKSNIKRLETTNTGIFVSGLVETGTFLATSTSEFRNNVKFDGGTPGTDINFFRSSNSLGFSDNAKANFGGSGNFSIYYDGSENILKGDSPTVFRNAANNETLAKLTPNGAVEIYHDNTKTLETTSNGIKLSNSPSGTISGAIKINTDFAGYGHIVVRDSNVNTLAALSVENANSGNDETNYIYRSVNLSSNQWANARLSAKRHAFQITADTPGSNEKLVIDNNGIKVEGASYGSYQVSGIRVNTTILNYGGISVRDASNSTGSNHIACFQAENGGTGTDETNIVTRSVNLNSSNWANAKYAAKSHLFTVNHSIDTHVKVRIDTDGLKFGTDTATANALDDYEEGDWTPGLVIGGSASGISYSTQSGKYTKVGRLVHLSCYLQLSSKGSNSGSVMITGLPFSPINVSGARASGSLGYYQGVSGVDHPILLLIEQNDTKFQVRQSQSTGSANVDNSNITDSFGIFFSLAYITNS